MDGTKKKLVTAALREADRIAAGFVPGEAELSGAPLLSDWIFETHPAGLIRLVGIVSGHPTIPDGWCTTSVVLVADETAGWARTVSRYYLLGPRLGEPRQ